MTSYFCPWCGIKTEGNSSAQNRGDHLLRCPCCGFSILFNIVARPTKTAEETEAIFQQTPLSDSQKRSRHILPKQK